MDLVYMDIIIRLRMITHSSHTLPMVSDASGATSPTVCNTSDSTAAASKDRLTVGVK